MHIVHVYPSDFRHESRIEKIATALLDAQLYREVELLGVVSGDKGKSEVSANGWRVTLLPRKRYKLPSAVGKLVGHLDWAGRVIGHLRRTRPDVVSAHSLSVLPFCALAARVTKAELIYEPHELETEAAGTSRFRRIVSRFIERHFIRFARRVIVIGDGFADWYSRTYRLPRVHVVRNVPASSGVPKPYQLKRELGIPESSRLYIYQGVLNTGRGVELMIEAFSRLSGTGLHHLLIMGFGPMRQTVESTARGRSNIHFKEAVPPAQIRSVTSSADVGLCLIEDICLSYRLSLPNKFFEYLHSNLPVVASDLPETRKIVEEFGCGVVTKLDVDSLERAVVGIDPAADALKVGVSRAAQEYSWDREKETIVNLHREVLDERARI